MPTNKPKIPVLFETEQEKQDFIDKAKINGRSPSNEFRVLADLPEIKHGGQREKAGRKKK